MTDNDTKRPPSDDKTEDPGGLEENTGKLEEDATRQITGDALEQIRESASQDMAPEWLENMRERKREAEKREQEDFDTPVPDAIQADGTPATAQMDPDEVGSLTEGMGMPTEDSEPDLEDVSDDPDTTEIEKDATKAINRGELDTLMKEREAEVAREDSSASSKSPAPGAGVISKASRNVTDRPTREVEDDAAAAIAEVDEEQETASSFSLPKPNSKARTEADTRPVEDPDDGLDDDSLGDFSDEDLHAVVFGGDEEEETTSTDAGEASNDDAAGAPRVEESPALDFSDISAEQGADEPLAGEPAQADGDDDASPVDAEVEHAQDDSEEQSAEDNQKLSPPDPAAEHEKSKEASGQADDIGMSDVADADLPDDFPAYGSEPKRPFIAAAAGFLAATAWMVGGALAMFTSMPSPWETLVPAASLGAGIVTFLLVLVGPPKWIEASILAAIGIGIGGFAFLQWSNLGGMDVTDYLGMAPLIGAGLALVAAVVTLIRPTGHVEDF
jgi:hypothetical protein